ncbi:hypothetical protein [Streptomyces sp. NPDC012888]|uniref:hypothetical protein n=1 Tax=Streptomyces sp. NPDC012888 TaxID=3364855 RepID=UPI0036825348
MELPRAVRLSLTLAAVLAGAGCVTVGAQQAGPASPVGSPGSPAPVPVPVPSPVAERPGAAAPGAAGVVLPLGRLPEPAEPARRPPAVEAGPGPVRQGQAAAPRKPRTRKPGAARPFRRPAVPAPGQRQGQGKGPGQAYGMDDVCAAADGMVPPSVVDLCVGQYGR